MTIRKCLLLIVGALVSVCMQAQSTLYERYINRYSALAVDQMQRYGVPASITLAQGLLESAAGTSRLAKEGNNHFGIKVGGSWNGPYMVMADDRPDDKFRVYHSANESFEDHSKFLRNNRRYASLFDLSISDYSAWAHGLKRAGYATSPTYAQALINVIEKYRLDSYDMSRRESREWRHEHKEEQKMQGRVKGREIRRCNSQYYIIARAGDTYASIGKMLKVKESKLRAYNDVDRSYSLKQGDVVYLGKKRKKADPTMKRRYHVMEAGESLYSIAQRYGIRLSSLCKMNPIGRNYHFRVGDEIKIK